MDGDGELDLVTANNGSFSVYPGVGDGTFGTPTVVPSVSSFFGAVAADFDEDGRLDLALADFGGDFLQVYLAEAPTPVPGLGFGGAAIGAVLAAGFAGRRFVPRR